MIRRCAWCGVYLGVKTPADDLSVTHGICTGCAAELLQTDAASVEEAPVVPITALQSEEVHHARLLETLV